MIEVICGPMFSGKSSELLRRVRREQIAKRPFLLFKPAIDNRFSEKEVVTHENARMEAIPVPINEQGVSEILERSASQLREGYVVAVDEVQFFTPQIVQVLLQIAHKQRRRVVVAGLDLDADAFPFGPVPALLALADTVTKLTAVCSECGSVATRTRRLLPPSEAGLQIQVGGKEAYQAVCAFCFERFRFPTISSFF